MTPNPQGTGARPTSRPGVVRTGADWINPPAPLSQWQRDRAAAPFERVGERWYISLALWVGAIATGPAVILLGVAFGLVRR